ncbi:MAG: porphobilinogen synthase, partial [Firmicutes bacterium]|nr:porphobilinogen synthase [Bacillota bacterium]
MTFPINRMRRLRASENLRSMVRETQLDVKDFIYPLFVTFGQDKQNPISSMPGVFQF